MSRCKDIMGKIKAVQINPRYDASWNEIRTIKNSSDSQFEAICNGFNYGYLQGMKAAKAEMKGGTAHV